MNKKQKGVFEGKLVRRGICAHHYDIGSTGARFYASGDRRLGYGRGFLTTLCKRGFEKSTGIKLKAGEEVMVKITIETTPIKVKK